MGKRLNKVLATILCTTLMVTTIGCSSKDGENKKGRYVEEMYEIPEGVYVDKMVQLDNGNILMVARGEDYAKVQALTSTDGGKSWESKDVELPKKDGLETYPMETIILKDGAMIVSYQQSEPMVEPTEEQLKDENFDYDKFYEEYYANYVEPETQYVKIDADGKSTELDIKFKDESDDSEFSNYVGNFACANNGDIFYEIQGETTEIVQLDGESFEEKNRYEADDWINSYLVMGNDLILVGSDSIIKYDIESGKEKGNLEALEKETIKSKGAYYPNIISSNSKDKIYYYSVLGLYEYDLKTEKTKQLVDGGISTFGSSDINVASFIEKENDEFLILFNDWSSNNGGYSLINFTYDADMKAVPDDKIVVYSLTENDAIRQAVSAYSKTHQDIYVKYEVGFSWGDGVTETDALKTLNTEIMNGNGPDVILLDGLLADSYIEKGLLEDLSDIVNSNEDLFSNVAKAYTVDGKVYQYPLNIAVPMLVGNKDKIDKVTNLESLTNLVKEIGAESPNRIFPYPFGERDMIYSLYYLYGNDWLNDDNTINEESITNYMNNAKDIFTLVNERYETYNKEMEKYWESMDKENGISTGETVIVEDDEDEEDLEKGEEYEEDANEDFYSMQWSLASSVYADGLVMDDKPANIAYGALTDTWSFSSLISTMFNNKDINYKVLSREDEKVFIPINCIGINAKSKNKDIAKEFVKELLSEKTQSSSKGWSNGLSVNKKVLAKAFEAEKEWATFDESINHYTQGSYIHTTMDGKEIEMKQIIPNDDDINKLIGEIEELTIAPSLNKVLLLEVAKQFESYVKGEISVDDAVNTIVDNLDLYLAE